jgi:hypothetical protein
MSFDRSGTEPNHARRPLSQRMSPPANGADRSNRLTDERRRSGALADRLCRLLRLFLDIPGR